MRDGINQKQGEAKKSHGLSLFQVNDQMVLQNRWRARVCVWFFAVPARLSQKAGKLGIGPPDLDLGACLVFFSTYDAFDVLRYRGRRSDGNGQRITGSGSKNQERAA